MSDHDVRPILFEGEADDGTRIRLAWDPADPEVITMFTLALGSKSTWSRPLELTRVEP